MASASLDAEAGAQSGDDEEREVESEEEELLELRAALREFG